MAATAMTVAAAAAEDGRKRMSDLVGTRNFFISGYFFCAYWIAIFRRLRESPGSPGTETNGDALARQVLADDVRKACLPGAAQAGRRRDAVRQSRHHRAAADGRLRGRERDQVRARPAGSRPDGDGGRLCA